MRREASAPGPSAHPASVHPLERDECARCGRACRTGDFEVVVRTLVADAIWCAACARDVPAGAAVVATSIYYEERHLALPRRRWPARILRRVEAAEAAIASLGGGQPS